MCFHTSRLLRWSSILRRWFYCFCSTFIVYYCSHGGEFMFWPGLRSSSVYTYQLGNYPTEEERERVCCFIRGSRKFRIIPVLRKLISTSVIFQSGGSGPPASSLWIRACACSNCTRIIYFRCVRACVCVCACVPSLYLIVQWVCLWYWHFLVIFTDQ